MLVMVSEAFPSASLCFLLGESSAEMQLKTTRPKSPSNLNSSYLRARVCSERTFRCLAGFNRSLRPLNLRLRPFLSDRFPQTARMKLILRNWFKASDDKTVAKFGTARLIQKPTGKIELIGGTAADRIAAKEWVSLFLHEATV